MSGLLFVVFADCHLYWSVSLYVFKFFSYGLIFRGLILSFFVNHSGYVLWKYPLRVVQVPHVLYYFLSSLVSSPIIALRVQPFKGAGLLWESQFQLPAF